MRLQEILASVPDYIEQELIENWTEQQVGILCNATINQRQRDSFVAVTTSDLDPFDTVLRQRFINAALLADWVSYSAPADRVEYPRLSNVINAFPQGFRVWFCQMPDSRYIPVAYTGWYPISEEIFNKAHDCPQDIRHRVELRPQSALSENGNYIWIFNYSIIKPLQKSAQSRKMLQTYAADINAINPHGLVAAVISEESKSVVRRFGMIHVGNMTHTGVSEEVWGARFPALTPHPTQRPEQI